MRHNVTTPGGFFVGLGGIVTFCAVAVGVYSRVGNPAESDELKEQQKFLGFAPKAERVEAKKKEQVEIDKVLDEAADKYNGGKRPNINSIDELRGLVRFRETNNAYASAKEALTARSNVEGKNVLDAAIAEVVKDIGAKKPAASAVKVDLNPPAERLPVPLPNLTGSGANTVVFPPISTPASPAPSAAPESAPAATVEKPQAASPIPSPVVASVPAPGRPSILNWSDLK